MSKPIRLTPRQQSILAGLAQGWDVGTVASAIQSSKATIYRDLGVIARALGYKQKATLAGMVTRARNENLISPNLRLSPYGYLTLTPGAAARGERQ